MRNGRDHLYVRRRVQRMGVPPGRKILQQLRLHPRSLLAKALHQLSRLRRSGLVLPTLLERRRHSGRSGDGAFMPPQGRRSRRLRRTLWDRRGWDRPPRLRLPGSRDSSLRIRFQQGLSVSAVPSSWIVLGVVLSSCFG